MDDDKRSAENHRYNMYLPTDAWVTEGEGSIRIKIRRSILEKKTILSHRLSICTAFYSNK